MTEWLAVISITCLAVISPGPDFAMVSRNALTLSRRAGIFTALGIGLGVLVHVGYTLLGIGVLIRETPMLFDLLKLAGAGYLVWLGLRMLRPATGAIEAQPLALTGRDALRIGFLTNVLNPKTTIFIVSLFMQVVGPDTPLATRLSYGAFIALAHIVWFASVGLFFGAGPMQSLMARARHRIDQIFGLCLIGFGLALAAANIGAATPG